MTSKNKLTLIKALNKQRHPDKMSFLFSFLCKQIFCLRNAYSSFIIFILSLGCFVCFLLFLSFAGAVFLGFFFWFFFFAIFFFFFFKINFLFGKTLFYFI